MSKKTLMTVAGVFLFLMMVTAVLFFVFWGRLSESKNNPAASSASLEKGVGQSDGEQTFALKTFVVNLADPGGKRYLRVGIVLAFKNADFNRELSEKLPQVRDKILMILPSKTFDDIKTSDGKTALKDEIVNGLNSFLKQGRISDLYFEEFVVQ
jgi:flagellar FliL protein